MVSNYTVNGIYVKDIVKVVIVTISKVYGRYGENTYGDKIFGTSWYLW